MASRGTSFGSIPDIAKSLLGPFIPATVGLGTFDTAIARQPTAWVTEGPIIFGEQIVAAARAVCKGDGHSIVFAPTDYAAHGVFLYTHPAAGGVVGTDTGTAWAAGDILDYVCKLQITGFSNLGAGQLAGVELIGASAGPDGDFTKTGVSKRICVGIDSAGKIWVVTANGAAATAVDTGLTAVSGTAFVLRIKFTKGTGVAVWKNGTAGTGATLTLPDHIYCHVAGFTNALAGISGAHFGGFWRMQSA